MKKIHATFITGFTLYTALSFAIARYPFVYHHRLLSILAALILLFLLWRLNRRPAKAPQRTQVFSAIAHTLCFITAVILASLIIFGLGHWRLALAHSAMERAGYHPTLPPNDVIDLSEKNGKTILDRLGNDENFKKAWTVKKNGRKLDEDIRAALQLAQGDAKADPNAMKNLRARRIALLPALKAIDKAQAAPLFSWNILYGFPIYLIEIPRFAHLQSCTRALTAEAMLLADEGNYIQAEARLKQALWLSKTVRQNFSLIASTFSFLMENIVAQGANMLFRNGNGASLAKAIEPSNAERSLKKSFEFEYLTALPGGWQISPKQALKWFRQNPFNPNLPEPWVVFSYPWITWDAAAMLDDGVARLTCLSNLPIEAAQCMDANVAYAQNYGWLLEGAYAINFRKIYLGSVACTARQRMAVLAYLSGRCKKIYHHWPARMEDFGKDANVTDPFTGNPFIFRMESGHFEIICVGADGVEDGDKVKEGLDKDIVIRL
jgi:hypothetical protein